jgi:hypothetical protein
MRYQWTLAASLALLLLGIAAVAQAPDSLPGCTYNVTPPALATGQSVGLQCDINGKLITSVSSGSSTALPPQGRLTLTTATPVMTATTSAQTTVYYTPYAGSFVPIYDGTNFQMTSFAEVSQLTTDTTKSPAAVAASSVYDIFCWIDTGPTNRCTRGPAWTNATTRSAGTALVRQNGIWLNNASITNGPAASRGTYVGTIASNAGSTIDYIFGAAASGGVPAVLNVWNAYNRVTVGTTVFDNGVGYNYTTGVVRQARASAGNQISFVLGLQEDSLQVSQAIYITLAAAANAFGQAGPGFDNTTAFSCSTIWVNTGTAATVTGMSSTACQWSPSIGVHVLSANESGDAVNANTFGSNGSGRFSNLNALLKM